jgi:drug/metabolite transporter (DMT)-like permease
MNRLTIVFAIIEMVLATTIWGSSVVVIKNGLLGVNAIVLVFYRFIIAAFIIGLILILLRKNLFQHLREGMILGLLLFVAITMQTIGLKYVSALNCGFISSLLVIFVYILSIILGLEKFRLSTIIAVVLVCLGIWNVTGGVGGFRWGEFLTLISSIIFALYVLYIDRVVQKCNIWVLNFQQFFFVAIASLFCGLWFKLDYKISLSITILDIVYLALFANILAFVLQFYSQKIISPVSCAIILALEPLFTAVCAWAIGGEQFKIEVAISGLIIVGSIIFLQLMRCDNKANNKA